MKITHEYPSHEFESVNGAVKYKLEPGAYTYEGQLEKLDECIRLQAEFIAQLTESLVDNKVITLEQLHKMLGYGFTVEG